MSSQPTQPVDAYMLVRCRLCGFGTRLVNGCELTDHIFSVHADIVLEYAKALGSLGSASLFTPIPNSENNRNAYHSYKLAMLDGFQKWADSWIKKYNQGKFDQPPQQPSAQA